MKHFLSIVSFLFLSIYTTWGQDYEVNSWQEIKENKKGKVVVLYNNTAAFTEKNSTGTLSGIDYELLTAFFDFTNEQYGVQIEAEWKEVDAFNQIYNGVLYGKSGIFGAGSISITQKRKEEIGLSPAYMPDIEVLTSSKNLPIAKSLKEFQEVFDTLTVLNIPQTTFEENVKRLRANYLPNVKMENVRHVEDLINVVVQKENYFGYVHLPIYALALQNGINIKRQNIFQVTRQGYAFIFPKESTWNEPVAAFFASQKYQSIIKKLLAKSFGDKINDLLIELAQQNAGDGQLNIYSSGEIALLTKEKELQSIKIQQNKLKLQQEQTIQYSLIGGLLMLVIIALALYNQSKTRRKSNLALSEKNEEIAQQRDYIADFHKKLTHSIQYAKRIQEAILPSIERIEKAFQDSFILYLPKDIVSGDFYWFTKIENKKIIALGDCTGHGVPGAFMTMLGTSILNYTIVEHGITNPQEALKQLDKQLRETLDDGQEQKSNDGMDIGICAIDTETQSIEFAAAKLALYRISHGELIRYKGSVHPIGDTRIKIEKDFPVKQIQYEKGDIIYLISDGYQDQFGGEENRKFMSQQLRELLLSIHDLPTSKQKEILFQKFQDWKGANRQTDDICVLGIRL